MSPQLALMASEQMTEYSNTDLEFGARLELNINCFNISAYYFSNR